MKDWLKERFATCYDGVSSARPPEYLPETQIAWGRDMVVRGGNPSTRPGIVELGYLPDGLFQRAGTFRQFGGMLVASIAGRIYRISFGPRRTFSVEAIPLDYINSPVLPRAYFCATPSALLIQDGQSRCIIYDGATARRSNRRKDEVPIGTHMVYANGRLHLAINGGTQLVSGDIVDLPGTELLFTETKNLVGGGARSFPLGITALAFMPKIDTQAGFGALLAFGRNNADSLHMEITARDRWQTTDGFQTSVFTDVGALGQVVAVNQDLYWRSGNGEIRTFRQVVSDLSGPGSAPISLEVSRLIKTDPPELLEDSSAVYFGNRLLMTAAPFLSRGATVYDRVVSLDFATIASMRGKSSPAYDGEWTGLGVRQLISGVFNERERAFAIITRDGRNILAEITNDAPEDIRLSKTFAGIAPVQTPIKSEVETRSFAFGDADASKRLERLDLFASRIRGNSWAWIYWRADNSEAWNLWDGFKLEQQADGRTTPTRTLTIPDELQADVYAHVGCLFQIRVEWQGCARIDRLRLFAKQLDESSFAERENSIIADVYVNHNGDAYVTETGNLYTKKS